VVAQAIAIRPFKERDREHFEALASSHHAQNCRDEFARGDVLSRPGPTRRPPS